MAIDKQNFMCYTKGMNEIKNFDHPISEDTMTVDKLLRRLKANAETIQIQVAELTRLMKAGNPTDALTEVSDLVVEAEEASSLACKLESAIEEVSQQTQA